MGPETLPAKGEAVRHPDLPDPPDLSDLPDLIVIGDSHSNALIEGCLAHGLRAEMLRFSGNFWHSGKLAFHPEHGIWITEPKNLQKQILDLRTRLGGRSVVGPDVPVLASMGFHLGRIVPPFGVLNHVTESRHFSADPRAQYVSQSLMDAYIGSARGMHVRMARRMAQAARMVIVAPPVIGDMPNMATFRDAVMRRMQAVNLNVYDPMLDLYPDGRSLEDHLITADNRHGNAAYGAAVIGKLIEQGQITPRV